jgi:hypothetical protein
MFVMKLRDRSSNSSKKYTELDEDFIDVDYDRE